MGVGRSDPRSCHHHLSGSLVIGYLVLWGRRLWVSENLSRLRYTSGWIAATVFWLYL